MVWLPLITAFAIDHGGVAGIPTQTAPPEQTAVQNLDEPVQVDDVEVFGWRGAAITPPEIELDEADIDALRAWSIDEVLQRMEETLGLSEPPLVLVNGRPTPNFSAYSGFPPDALARAEVLPPEASGIYGTHAGQRVVNLVFQPQFSSYDGRVVGARRHKGGPRRSLGTFVVPPSPAVTPIKSRYGFRVIQRYERGSVMVTGGANRAAPS